MCNINKIKIAFIETALLFFHKNILAKTNDLNKFDFYISTTNATVNCKICTI